jgi:hypothetical protein
MRTRGRCVSMTRRSSPMVAGSSANQTLLAPQVHAIVTFAQALTAFAPVVVALRLGRQPARVGQGPVQSPLVPG